jgi:uncharacterized protein
MTTTPMKPVPTPDEASAPFFQGAREGRLVIMRCRPCGAWRMPARDRCDRCWSTDTEWAQASGRGKVYTFGIMHQVYHPAFATEVPYNVAVVELDEGVRMTTNITGVDNDSITVGMAVAAVFEPVSDTVSMVRFRPVT